MPRIQPAEDALHTPKEKTQFYNSRYISKTESAEMIKGLSTYLIKKFPGRPGIFMRKIYYGKYFGHKEFVIHDNVTITGFKKNITVGKNFRVNPDVKIFSSEGTLNIGSNVYLNYNCFLSADRSIISIGNDCLFANNVTVWCSNHGFGDTKN